MILFIAKNCYRGGINAPLTLLSISPLQKKITLLKKILKFLYKIHFYRKYI